MLGPELIRDVGCRANLVWRCDLLEAADATGFVSAATATAFEAVPDASRMGLQVLAEPGTGHRVVVVLRTGRVQIRLDALTDADARVMEGRRVFERLREATHADPAPTGGGP